MPANFFPGAHNTFLPGHAGPSSSSYDGASSPLGTPSVSNSGRGGDASSQQRRRRHRPRCGQCGSKRFRRNPDTGLLVCREGHVLQGYREEEVHDDQDYVALGQRRRRAEGQSRRKKTRRNEQPEAWTGGRAAFLSLECQQLILRLQLKALRLEWPDLPPEVEPIARDLWALYVSSLRQVDATPYTENRAFAAEQLRFAREESVRSSLSRGSRSRSRSRMLMEDRQREMDSQRDREDEERRVEAEERRLEAELRGSRRADSTEIGEDEDPPQHESDSQGPLDRLKFARARRHFSPMVTIVTLIYLSLITARIPVMWSDLRLLMTSNRMPYTSIINNLPSAMTIKMPPTELKRLRETSIPSTQTLQESTSQLARQLNDRFNVQFPELNAAPVLWRCVRQMGLPPTFFRPVTALLALLGVPMAVVGEKAIADPWTPLGSGESTNGALPHLPSRLSVAATTPPFSTRCSIVMAALIVVAKMRYGLDGMERLDALARDSHDDMLMTIADNSVPASLREVDGAPNLGHWLAALSASIDERQRHPAFAFELGVSPGHLSDDAIDSLLDYAEVTFSSRHSRRNKNLKELFGASLPDVVLPPNLPPFKSHDSASSLQQGTGQAHIEQKKSLLDVQAVLAKNLNARLYPVASHNGATDEQEGTPPRVGKSFAPGEGYVVPGAKQDGIHLHHPEYHTVLSYAATIVAGGDVTNFQREVEQLGELVGDVERLLLSRINKLKRQDGAAAKRSAGSQGPGVAERIQEGQVPE